MTYSLFIRFARIGLQFSIFALLALLFLWPRLFSNDTRFDLGSQNANKVAKFEGMQMKNPRYLGTDSKNQPFVVTANLAHQKNSDDSIVILDDPKADISLEQGGGIFIGAKTGYYHQREQRLTLTGQVDVFEDRGYEFHTQQAQIDLAKSQAFGSDPVEGQALKGSFSAENGFHMDKNTRIMTLIGKSKILLKSTPVADSNHK